MEKDPFRTTDCCGIWTPSVSEDRSFESYKYLHEAGIFDSLDTKILSGIVFGNLDMCDANLLMDLQMLILYLRFIYEERELDFIINGGDYGNQHYRDLYCLECIENKFHCRGVDVEVLTKIFIVFNLEEEPSSTGESRDGIGFMQIEGDGSVYPKNRIRD